MSVRLNLQPLARAVQEHARGWVLSLGKLLKDSAKENLYSLNSELVQMAKDLEKSPEKLDDLKFVLGTIANTKTMSLDVQMRIVDITERLVVLPLQLF